MPFVCYGSDEVGDCFAGYAVDAAGLETDSVDHLVGRSHARIELLQTLKGSNLVCLSEAGFSAFDTTPAAVICEFDALAVEAMSTFGSIELFTENEVAVISYENELFSAFAQPPLTTFSQNSELGGRWEVEIAMAILGGMTPSLMQRLRAASFAERSSSAAPTGRKEPKTRLQ